MSAAADAVGSTVSNALQGSGVKGLEAPVPKSVARQNAAKVGLHSFLRGGTAAEACLSLCCGQSSFTATPP